MTALLLTLLVFLASLGVYIASLVARTGKAGDPRGFLDAGARLPGWAAIFAGGGVLLSGIDLPGHLALVGRYGLQAGHLALGLVPAVLALVLVQKRLWLAARIAGLSSPVEALAGYYESVTLRLFVLTVAVLFALPLAAGMLAGAAGLLSVLTDGVVPRGAAIWGFAFALFLPAVMGGWRAAVLVLAIEALLLATLLVATAGLAELLLPGPGFPQAALPVPEGTLADAIPGVAQYSAGIGKETAQGGIFTTLAILSDALALMGLTLSPGMLLLGMTTHGGRSLAFGSVWVMAGLVTGLLLALAPLIVARAGGGGLPVLVVALAGEDPLAGAALALVLLIAGLMATSFFVTSGTLLVVRDLVMPFILPNLSPRDVRLSARIALALAFLMLAMLATFSPLAAAVFRSLALPLSAQLFPALLGLAFLRWISRSAVLTGLVLGSLAVFMTEPPGLILFEGLFLDLPWGRWPLTIHSAGWGLALNLGAVLLVSIFTRKGDERLHRDRLHDAFATQARVNLGGSAARGAKWSLTLIWTFLALGPGAILGNSFFSQPIFAGGEAALGLPSLWVWQLFFWLLGIPLVWWLAYGAGLGLTAEAGLRRERWDVRAAPVPGWIAAALARVTGGCGRTSPKSGS
ncbi:MAG: hypothetical protein LBE86_01140 [Gemmobacter sp.]|nr:hypothetical protein [Gemmobacter sp.]